MSCRATFNFIKGPCIGRVITHDFDAGATVAHIDPPALTLGPLSAATR
jgi:hypothetical protein